MSEKKPKKKLYQIERELDAARAEYHELSAGLTDAQQREYTDKIKALMAELNDAIAADAQDCPTKDCGARPIAMKRRAGVYEVGCPVCENMRATAETPEEAVDKWNDGDLMPAQERTGGFKTPAPGADTKKDKVEKATAPE